MYISAFSGAKIKIALIVSFLALIFVESHSDFMPTSFLLMLRRQFRTQAYKINANVTEAIISI
jgi:hypothetical protein